MEQTFVDKVPANQGEHDAERRKENAVKDVLDSQQKKEGGAAGRQQVASKDPKETDYDVRGGPGSMGNKPVQDPVM